MQNRTGNNAKKLMPRKPNKYWGAFYLNKVGHTAKEISGVIELPLGTARNIVRRIKHDDNPLPRKQPGAPKKIDQRARNHLRRIIRKDSFTTYNQQRLELRRAGVIVSRPILITCVKELGFGSFIAARKPKLTRDHKRIRLLWAKEHIEWTRDQRDTIIWSDESRFSLHGDGNSRRVIRVPGERYKLENAVPTVKWGGGGLMVWGCFYGKGLGPLAIIDGTVNQDVYINILAEEFHPWFSNLTKKEERPFLFQEDGASCHTGGYARWWKESHMIRGFEYWPVQSPDLNPIEHI